MKLKKLMTTLLGTFLFMAWPLVSMAHVHMDKSDPANGATLSVIPKSVDTWFSGKVAAEWSKIEVTDANGKRVDTGEVSDGGDPKHLSVGLKSVAPGSYDVKLNVISGDGHRVKSSFSFSIK